jgi:hypothetical protein
VECLLRIYQYTYMLKISTSKLMCMYSKCWNTSFMHEKYFFFAFSSIPWCSERLFTTFRFSHSLVSDVHMSFVDPTCTGESNEMKRSEPCPLIYPANPEAYNNRKFNKYGGIREKHGRLWEFCLYLLNHISFKLAVYNSPLKTDDDARPSPTPTF